MQSTIQETNKPVTTQTHLELLLQPAGRSRALLGLFKARRPTMCRSHQRPPWKLMLFLAIATSAWGIFWDGFCVARSRWTGATCVAKEQTVARHGGRMNRGTELNRIAWLTWNEVELHWNEWIEQNEMTWIERKNAWMNANELNWIELRWIELTWSKLMCSELSCNDLNWAEYYFIELTLTHWIELN